MAMTMVDGDWACVARTPMGEQRFTVTVETVGDTFSGRVAGALGSMAIERGRVHGNQLDWTMEITMPMPLSLDCSATIDGDRLTGAVRAGGFGSFPLEGERA
jgi:hypothetical protein